MSSILSFNIRRSSAEARSPKSAQHTVSLRFTSAQLDRLRAGAKFLGVNIHELCIAGCLHVMDMNNSNAADAKATTVRLIDAYSRRRVTFNEPEAGTDHAFQVGGHSQLFR